VSVVTQAERTRVPTVSRPRQRPNWGEVAGPISRRDYSEFQQILGRIFSPHHVRPRIAVECDGANSLIAAVEGGQGVALVSETFKRVAGKRLIYRPLLDANEAHTVGIGRPAQRQTRPAEEKFCDTLREISVILAARKSVRSKSPRSSDKTPPRHRA
jgi:DNA-binding transcriptional LysR family regulator